MVITTVLVGFFDDPLEAGLARDELIDSGIDPRSVELMSQSVHRERKVRDPEGNVAMESGSAVMRVSISDDMRIEEVTDILEIHGSSDTEQYAPEQRIAGDTPSNPDTARF